MNLKTLIAFFLLCGGVFAPLSQAQNTTTSKPLGQTEWQVAPGIMGEEAVLQHRLVANHSTVTPGQNLELTWEFAMQPGWHIYWQNAGDSGLPPQLKPILEGGTKGTALPLTYPVPEVITIPPITNYGYHGRVRLGTTFNVPATMANGAVALPFHADYLYCKDVCLPGTASLTLNLSVANTAIANPNFKPATPPKVWPYGAIEAEIDEASIKLKLPTTATEASFFPATEGVIEDGAKQVLNNGTLTLTRDTTTPKPTVLEGVIKVGPESYTVNTPLKPVPLTLNNKSSSRTGGFFLMAFYAVLAGLILNLMPCVLPVLSLKLFGMVRHQNGPARVRYALAYTGGVLASFWAFALVILVLKASGASLGWGFHLQQPLVVAGLTLLMVILAVNFWGVFSIGENLTRLAGKPKSARQESGWSSFATGSLAVVVATPCTVPFMGAALGYALLETNALATFGVFTALGLGMAMPFLAIAASPNSLKWLPKPGVWMVTFKQLLGWPMLLTALWLAYVYQSLTGQVPAFALLLGALLVAFTLWLYGRKTSSWRLGLVLLSIAATLWGGYRLNQPQPELWQMWAIEKVAAAQTQGQPVFIDFTADWCLTCKVTEATVLNTPSVQNLFAEHNVLLLKADWTNRDDAITTELAKHGRQGVPLYLLYVPGQPTPEILPQLLSHAVLKAALENND